MWQALLPVRERAVPGQQELQLVREQQQEPVLVQELEQPGEQVL